jgi:hypothetical protein
MQQSGRGGSVTNKLSLAVITIALVALATGCGTSERSAAPTTETGATQTGATIVRASLNADSPLRAELITDRPEVKAGEAASLIFSVKDTRGAIVRDLKIVHEKPMHLLLVSNDLAEFSHIHPEPQPDGTLKVTHTFPHGGLYKLYADFTHKSGQQVVERYDVNVRGLVRPPSPLAADTSLDKKVESLSVTMFPDKALRAGQELMLNFAVADAETGKPVTDLQNYLGALAHFVIISEDSADFLHVHPLEPSEMKGDMSAMKTGDKNGTPERAITVSAHTIFPRVGLYKLWAQFQRGGRVITVPFVVHVGSGEANVAAANAGANTNAPLPAGAIKVTVNSDGFEPSQIPVKKGQPVKLAFYRADEQNCASEVFFPSLKIRKKLPVGKIIIVNVTPQKSGELAFGCGMGMYQGTLLVSN